MNDVLTGTDRILNTPLPIAYSIAITQITWIYILLLPFQLFKALDWITIPASYFAAYIIHGIALIGREIENPFGEDVNDLPLDTYCEQIRKDIDIIMSRTAPVIDEFAMHSENMPMYPLSNIGSKGWADKSVDEIRDALASKPGMRFPLMEHEEHPKLQRKDGYNGYYRPSADDRAESGEADLRVNQGGNGGRISGWACHVLRVVVGVSDTYIITLWVRPNWLRLSDFLTKWIFCGRYSTSQCLDGV